MSDTHSTVCFTFSMIINCLCVVCDTTVTSVVLLRTTHGTDVSMCLCVNEYRHSYRDIPLLCRASCPLLRHIELIAGTVAALIVTLADINHSSHGILMSRLLDDRLLTPERN